MSAFLVLDVDQRLTCRCCKGEGVVSVRPRDCHHSGICPCGSDVVLCPDECYDGRRQCLHCGERADRIDADGEPRCAACPSGRMNAEARAFGRWLMTVAAAAMAVLVSGRVVSW